MSERITDSRAFQPPSIAQEPTLVVLGDRQTGKTARLLTWLLGGHAIDAWPSWSRVLIVANEGKRQETVGHSEEFAVQLRQVGGPDLAKVVLVAGDYAVTRLAIRHDVEVAIDDVHEHLFMQVGIRPAVVALDGQSYDRRQGTEPFIDGRGIQHIWYPLDHAWGHVGHYPAQCEDVLCPDFTGEAPKP